MTRPAGIAASAIQAQPVAHRHRRRAAAAWIEARPARDEERWPPRSGSARTANPTRPHLRLAACSDNTARSRPDRRSARQTIRDWTPHREHRDCRPADGRWPRTSLAAAARSPTARRTADPIESREQTDEPDRDVGRRRRAKSVRNADRQRHGRRGQDAEMDQRADAERQEADQQMGIGVAGEQRRLEEHHRHRPDGRRAAEPRQHHLGEHRLHREQEQRRQEQRSRQTARGASRSKAPAAAWAGGCDRADEVQSCGVQRTRSPTSSRRTLSPAYPR